MTVPPGHPGPGSSNPYGPPPGQSPSPGYPTPYEPPPGHQNLYGPYPGGMPPGYPNPYGQQPQPPKKSNALKYVLPIAVLFAVLVLGGVVFLTYHLVTSVSNAKEGDCIHVTEFVSETDKEPKKLDCADDKANFKVGVRVSDNADSCPEGDYSEIRYTEGPRLCLVINADDGECFTQLGPQNQAPKKVQCDDHSAEVEIMKVVEGTTDPNEACRDTDAEDAVIYSEPSTVMCASHL